MAHEGQRDTNHRGQPHDHHKIDRDIEEDRRNHTASQKAPQSVARRTRDGPAPAQDQKEGKQDGQPADQAPFLRHRGEHEVGMRFGQVIEMALRTLVEPFAGEAP